MTSQTYKIKGHYYVIENGIMQLVINLAHHGSRVHILGMTLYFFVLEHDFILHIN